MVDRPPTGTPEYKAWQESSAMPIVKGLNAAQQAKYDDNFSDINEHRLALGRLLYEAAFPERPPLGLDQALPPLYLYQATAIDRNPVLGNAIISAINKVG